MRRRWIPRLFLLTSLLACVSGCNAPRTVFVQDAEPVRIGPDVYGHVYVHTEKGWELSANKVHIPEGRWALPAPPPEPKP